MRTRTHVPHHLPATALVAGILVGPGSVAANTPWPAPMDGVMEQAITFKELGDAPKWHIAELAQGGNLYKGMDVTCANVKRNDDVNNRFVHAPTWLGDPDTANAYAIRATAKVALKQRVVLIDQLEQYDPTVATIAEYQATRPLRLLVLMDRQNIANLLGLIEAAIDKKLQTGIGGYIATRPWLDVMDVDDDPHDDRYTLLRELARNRQVVEQFIKGNGDRPLGMTKEEMDFMFQNLRAKAWEDEPARRRVMKRNKREAFRIVDDLIAMQREMFVVRFATGYQMGWAGQKRVLGDYRVANRNLTNVDTFPNGPYDLTYPGTNWTTVIGPDPTQLNRISLMNRDLELMEIVKKYVNVDGYWSPETPSLWHRNQRFHSEAALIYPATAVEFTGRCADPFKTQQEPVEED